MRIILLSESILCNHLLGAQCGTSRRLPKEEKPLKLVAVLIQYACDIVLCTLCGSETP